MLRSATPDDVSGLLALEAQFPGDRLSPRQLRRHLQNPRAKLRVLVADQRLAGYALVFTRRGSRTARLYSIAVDPALRGRGFGVSLLRDAEAQARAAGCDRLQLEVRVDNDAAQALYRREGYERFGAYPDYYEDGAAAARFGKALGPLPLA